MASVCALIVTANPFPDRLLGLNLIERGSAIALGVSGGGDSLAMLYAITAWAKATDCAVYVFTVDHKLRPESADEAAFVADHCERLGLKHQTLLWDAPKPSQNAARLARHRLLADACRAVGARYLLLGHTLDDVIETRVMRRQRGVESFKTVGPMPVAVSPVWPQGRDILVLRPLLLSNRDDLRTWLLDEGHEWVDDPSNESDAYERPRVRKALAVRSRSPAASEALRDLQARARAEGASSAVLRQCAARCDGFGLIRIPATVDRDILTNLMSILVPIAAGNDRIPKAYASLTAMADIMDEASTRYTIGGAWLQRAGLDILIGREPGRGDISEENGVFDGRFVRELGAVLPEPPAHFLVRHALPPDRDGWRSLIPARLEAYARAFEANADMLTKPRVSGLS